MDKINEVSSTQEQSTEDSKQDLLSVFDGYGAGNEAGSCTGCGNKFFFAVKLAV